MNETLLVSVIIPAYNAGAFVREAIDSALAQTYHPIEVIVVDDGSTDDTPEILKSYGDTITIVRQPNAGLSAARNTAIRHAKGKYVALLDADDIFFPEKVKRQVTYLETHSACDMCYCGIYHFWDGEPDRLFTLDYHFFSGDEVLPNLVKRGFIAPLAMFFRRSTFERFGFFDEAFRYSEDIEFLVRILSQGARIEFLDERLAKLRLRRQGNLQSFATQPQLKRAVVTVFERLSEHVSSHERTRLELPKYLSLYQLKTAFAYLENGDKKNAKPFIFSGFRGRRFGIILAYGISIGIAIIPKKMLAYCLQRYHLRSQRSF